MFEWDKGKAKQNEAKHGVSFADTFAVFEDSNALTLDQIVSGEERHVDDWLGCVWANSCGGLHVAWREHPNHFGTKG